MARRFTIATLALLPLTAGCAVLESGDDYLNHIGAHPDPDQPGWHQFLFGTRYVSNSLGPPPPKVNFGAPKDQGGSPK